MPGESRVRDWSVLSSISGLLRLRSVPRFFSDHIRRTTRRPVNVNAYGVSFMNSINRIFIYGLLRSLELELGITADELRRCF